LLPIQAFHILSWVHTLKFAKQYYQYVVACFVDLEKAFDRVPREVISWAMHKLGVEEWLVSAVMFYVYRCKTVVRTVYSNSKGFEVKVGMHPWFRIKPIVICDCHGGHI